MFKKIGTVVLAAAVAFAVGCAGKETKKDEPVKQEKAQPAQAPAPEPTPAPEPPKPPPPPTCTQTQVLDENVCLDVATALQGLRVEMPCKPGGKKDECAAAVARPSKAVQIGGKAGQAYDITLRFRGVVETGSYTGGQQQEYFNAGGKPSDKKANVYQLEVTAPANTYFLNAGGHTKRVWAVDYNHTIRVDSGATVTLVGDSQDSKMVPNRDMKNVPQIVPDVPPAPAAFEGQFMQVDVVSVAPAR